MILEIAITYVAGTVIGYLMGKGSDKLNKHEMVHTITDSTIDTLKQAGALKSNWEELTEAYFDKEQNK